MTIDQLRAIYSCKFTGTVNGRFMGSATVPNRPLLPRDGTDTRRSWLFLMALPVDGEVASDGGTLPSCIDDGAGDAESAGDFGTDVGAALTNGRQIVPMGTAAWIAKGNKASTDDRGLSQLGTVLGFGTTTSTGASPYDISYAWRAGSGTPRDLTMAQLRAIYHCQFTGIVDGRSMSSPTIPNRPLLPATYYNRSNWLFLMGFDPDADVASDGGTLPTCIDDGPGDSRYGGDYRPDQGNVLTDSRQIIPHAVTSWVWQGDGTDPDNRGLSLLGAIDGRSPLTVAGRPVSAFAFQRSNPAYSMANVPSCNQPNPQPGYNTIQGQDTVYSCENAVFHTLRSGTACQYYYKYFVSSDVFGSAGGRAGPALSAPGFKIGWSVLGYPIAWRDGRCYARVDVDLYDWTQHTFSTLSYKFSNNSYYCSVPKPDPEVICGDPELLGGAFLGEIRDRAGLTLQAVRATVRDVTPGATVPASYASQFYDTRMCAGSSYAEADCGRYLYSVP